MNLGAQCLTVKYHSVGVMILKSLCESVPSDGAVADVPLNTYLYCVPPVPREIEASERWNCVDLVEDRKVHRKE